MYLVDLKIQGLKLLRDFSLSCMNEDKSPRMWTVLLGENGLCKTSILQAIAMAASGYVRSNQLADIPSLPDRRIRAAHARVDANFTFGPWLHSIREYPGLQTRPDSPPILESHLTIEPGHNVIKGVSVYRDQTTVPASLDPIEDARARNLHLWFVAGYGTSRLLPRPLASETSEDPILSRLSPLFDRGRLIGTGFADLFQDPLEFERTLREALVESQLLPRATDINLRGPRGARSSVDQHRLGLRVGAGTVKVPATWLSQGYQSTIAWIADVIGQVFWEADGPVPLSEMEGLVLIDELDLHLHPKWQLRLIPTLKRVFPRLQFIVTTHSPMVLPGLKREEVVLLKTDEQGNVVAEQSPEEPALLTGSEIYRTFFGIDRLHPAPLGEDLRRYSFLIADPMRTDAEDQEMRAIQQRLAEAGVDPGWEPIAREQVPSQNAAPDKDKP